MMEKKSSDLKLSKMAVKRIGHEINGRITDDAALRVALEEEERMKEIFRMAQDFANHDGREGIQEDDVRLAYKYVK